MENKSSSTYFDVIQPYIIGVAIGAGLIGFGQGIYIPGLSNALTYAGCILDAILFCIGLAEYWRARDAFYTLLNIQRNQSGLPLIHFDNDMFHWHRQQSEYEKSSEPQEEILSQVVNPVIVEQWTKKSDGRLDLQRKENSNPPSKDFILQLYSCKQDGSNRIPSEPSIIKMGVDNGGWNSSQALKWLGDLDADQFTERLWDSPNNNAPRRFKLGLEQSKILAHYGYS